MYVITITVHISKYTGLSDPFVEILLIPEERFKIKAVKTEYKSKELNPFYAKDFKMYVAIHYSRYSVAMCSTVNACILQCIAT